MTSQQQKQIQIVGAVVGVIVASVFSLMLFLPTTVTAVDPNTIEQTIGIVQPGPSPKDVPRIVDTWEYVPMDKLPSTGKPQLMISEIQGKPDKYNKINYQAAKWIQDPLSKPGKYVDLPEQSKAEFFGYLNSVRNNMAYYEVTYPDGSVKYFHVDYHEVP
jgi:hypothetical protein